MSNFYGAVQLEGVLFLSKTDGAMTPLSRKSHNIRLMVASLISGKAFRTSAFVNGMILPLTKLIVLVFAHCRPSIRCDLTVLYKQQES